MLAAGDQVGDWIIEGPAPDFQDGWARHARHAVIEELTARVWAAEIPEEGVDSFLREARAAQRVMHPAVARLAGFGYDATRKLAWVAEDPTPGRPGGEVTRAEVGEVVSWIEAIADGLGTAHAMGSFHLGIGPDALRIDGSNTRIVGLGLQALRRASGRRGAAYLPPEGAAAPGPADVYALGRLLAEWVEGASWAGPALPQGFFHLPSDVEALVREVCAPRPEDRLVNPLELRDRLRAIGPAARWSSRRAATADDTWSGIADPTGDTWTGAVPDATWSGEYAVTDPALAAPAPTAPPSVPPAPPRPGVRRIAPLRISRFGLLWIGLFAGLLGTGLLVGVGAAWIRATMPVSTFSPFDATQAPPAPEPPPSAPPPGDDTDLPPIPAPPAAGDLSREPAFRAGIERLSESARQCARRNKGNYDQVLDVTLAVREGRVVDVRLGALAMPTPARKCVSEAAKNLTFPPSLSGTGRADLLWGDPRR